MVRKGLPEPFCQRTVEGDMGMRISAANVLEAFERGERVRDPSLPADAMATYVDRLTEDTASLPARDQERRIECELARTASAIASERHAGRLTPHYLPGGETAYIQAGKDLTRVGTLIGTGGIFGHAEDARSILLAATYEEAQPFSLRPKSPRFLVDRRYLLFGAGLLATLAPDAALRIMKRHLTES